MKKIKSQEGRFLGNVVGPLIKVKFMKNVRH